jgi:birA, biotin-[acetyl-CoA-carboxylase] ligase region
MCINPSDTGKTATSSRFSISDRSSISSPIADHSPIPNGISVPGWNVAAYPLLDSTNLEAKRCIVLGCHEKLLILAESQTNGQCRHDRLWDSPANAGIWASFILPVTVPFEMLPQSTLVLAVAVQEGIAKATRIPLAIKWPNDLLGNDKKCCGLLVETALEITAQTPVPLVLGVGINCNQAQETFPLPLQKIATSLSMLASGRVFSRELILCAIAGSIDLWFGIWQTHGFSPVREAWLAHNGTLGKTVVLPEGYGQPHGKAYDLDDSGSLLVLADNNEHIRIESGEILFSNRTDSNALAEQQPSRL